MWYTILILLALDIGGLLLVYALLRDRVRRATTANAQISEIREEMSRLVVELNQTTDRNIALIEDRIASLNELLSAADKKIGLLHREIEKHDVGTQVYSRLVEGRSMRGSLPAQGLERERPPRPKAEGIAAAPQSGREPPATGSPRSRDQEQQRGQELQGAAAQMPQRDQESQGAAATSQRSQELQRATEMPQRDQESQGAAAQMPPGAAAVRPLSVELSEATQRPEKQEAGEAPDLQQRVLMLHRAGFAASLIASRVGAPLGEIELIISLEQRKGRA